MSRYEAPARKQAGQIAGEIEASEVALREMPESELEAFIELCACRVDRAQLAMPL